MSARSLNQVQLIGNLTRDPELRYTPKGAAVCDFGVATNRSWVTAEGESQEESEFHNVVAWGKLAELCSQLLRKGRKVFIQGRLRTRSWEDDSRQKHWKTEIVAEEMMILDSKRVEDFGDGSSDSAEKGGKELKDGGSASDFVGGDDDDLSDQVPF